MGTRASSRLWKRRLNFRQPEVDFISRDKILFRKLTQPVFEIICEFCCLCHLHGPLPVKPQEDSDTGHSLSHIKLQQKLSNEY